MASEVSLKAFKRLKRKLENEVLWIYVANILLHEDGLSVTELKKRLKEKFSIKVNTVYLYTVLYRMEREGLVRRKTSEEGKSMYCLEEVGKQTYLKGLEYLNRIVKLLAE
ncbi:MAG: helix-turn-helix transcriptional regulator [Infirmifilum sp.]|uniref:helix-turn-helix transcriptional regulator n=1 Tax=Infirmifilum TaxID=2856573 RepID=UPI00168D6BC6|nr:helix-turn-helix transcriptional regulator [Infirmifilum uzonense]